MVRKHWGMLAGFCGLLLLLTALPAKAHHSVGAEYDFNKPLLLTGIMTRAEFLNPHCVFALQVTNPDGTKTEWVFQAGAAGNLRKSLSFPKPNDLIGKTYTFHGYANKNGTTGGFLTGIDMPDGKKITLWYQERDPNGTGAQ